MFAEFGVLNFWTYVVGAFFIVLVPGPNTLFVLKTGIGHGVKKGYLAATGVFIGDAVLMFLAWAGVDALIQTTPVLFNIVRYLGAFYLLWLGGKMLWSVMTRQKNAHESSAEPASAILKRSLVLSLTILVGALTILFNAVVDVLYAVIDPKILATTLELISFMYMSFLIFSGAFVTRYLKTKKKLAKLGNGLIGLLFVGFAARLASLH